MSEEKLRNCPFCGQRPTVHKNDMVVCANEDCFMHYDDDTALASWNSRPIEDKLNERIGELPEVYRDGDGKFIPFLVCEGDGGHPFIAMYNGINWWAGIFVPDITHWMPLPELPEVQE